MRRSFLLAGVGAFLALGAPAGWLVVRWMEGAPPAGELRAHPGLYGYLLAATIIAFSAFGAFSGVLADRLSALNQELRKLSGTDALTGLANLRQFRERLKLEEARARRSGEPLALIILDLDGLKTHNDRLGHDGGDAVLVYAAAMLRKAVREVDLPCRIGGDEFAVICPNAMVSGALAVAERVRGALASAPFPAPDGSPVLATASLGVAALEDGAEQLFRAADRALYVAKSSGRNCVRVTPSLT